MVRAHFPSAARPLKHTRAGHRHTASPCGLSAPRSHSVTKTFTPHLITHRRKGHMQQSTAPHDRTRKPSAHPCSCRMWPGRSRSTQISMMKCSSSRTSPAENGPSRRTVWPRSDFGLLSPKVVAPRQGRELPSSDKHLEDQENSAEAIPIPRQQHRIRQKHKLDTCLVYLLDENEP